MPYSRDRAMPVSSTVHLPSARLRFIGSGAADTTNYLSIGAGGTENHYVLTMNKNAFGLYWGSVDSYNNDLVLITGRDAGCLLHGRGRYGRCFPTGNQGFLLLKRLCGSFAGLAFV